MRASLRQRLPLLVLGSAVLILLLMPLFDSGSERSSRSEPGAVPVVVTRVARADLRETYQTVGTLAGRSEVRIAAQAPGVLRDVAVQPGDVVERGQNLAALDERVLRAELAQAEAAYRRSADELERVRQLAESDLAETKRVEAAVAQHAIDSAAADKLRTQLAQSRFPSPFDGVVTAQLAYPGDALRDGTPILALADVTRLRAVTKIPATVTAQLMPETPAVLETYDGREFAASVALVHPTADPVSHQTVVELDAGDAFPRLKPGFLVKIRLTLVERRQVLALDRRALPEAQIEGTAAVFVIADGRAERREVELGLVVEERAEIVRGLREGELVVARGGGQLTEGAPVRIVAELTAPAAAE